jgi:hypothetical protein
MGWTPTTRPPAPLPPAHSAALSRPRCPMPRPAPGPAAATKGAGGPPTRATQAVEHKVWNVGRETQGVNTRCPGAPPWQTAPWDRQLDTEHVTQAA